MPSDDEQYTFVTCCKLHNILLKEDGYLVNSDIPDFPSGVKARLNKISNDPRGDGLWICDECNDDTH